MTVNKFLFFAGLALLAWVAITGFPASGWAGGGLLTWGLCLALKQQAEAAPERPGVWRKILSAMLDTLAEWSRAATIACAIVAVVQALLSLTDGAIAADQIGRAEFQLYLWTARAEEFASFENILICLAAALACAALLGATAPLRALATARRALATLLAVATGVLAFSFTAPGALAVRYANIGTADLDVARLLRETIRERQKAATYHWVQTLVTQNPPDGATIKRHFQMIDQAARQASQPGDSEEIKAELDQVLADKLVATHPEQLVTPDQQAERWGAAAYVDLPRAGSFEGLQALLAARRRLQTGLATAKTVRQHAGALAQAAVVAAMGSLAPDEAGRLVDLLANAIWPLVETATLETRSAPESKGVPDDADARLESRLQLAEIGPPVEATYREAGARAEMGLSAARETLRTEAQKRAEQAAREARSRARRAAR
jgi:hypothetical protein